MKRRTTLNKPGLLATATFAASAVLTVLVWLASQHARAQAPASAPAAAAASAAASAVASSSVTTVPGMPPVVDARNLYSETAAGKFSAAVQGDVERIYVPNLRSDDVYVIDPPMMKVIDRFKVGDGPQHIVPSWDLRTLWVTNNAEGTTDGSLTPIDPRTGKPGKPIKVDDPYNMYFDARRQIGDRGGRGAQAAGLP